jgi:hypothetical protein
VTSTPTLDPQTVPEPPHDDQTPAPHEKEKKPIWRDLLLVALTTVAVLVINAGWSVLIDPPRADVQFTLYGPPSGVHVGDRPTAHFKVENEGKRTAPECVIRWTPGDGLRSVDSRPFALRAGQEFPVSLRAVEFTRGGAAHGSLFVRCGDGEQHTVPVTTTVLGPRSHSTPAALTLDSVPPCVRVTVSSPLGRRLGQQRAALVDGRCDTADNLNKAVSIYPEPTQAGSKSIAAASTGIVLQVTCSASGQPRQDVRAQSSALWLRVTLQGRTGYIPEIWTQHGSVPPC